jgi:2-amino-4-hydroxy-6-hydroxymethyldihydropteridine diphosphokinase
MLRNVYIGLGANLGDRLATIEAAIAAIEDELVEGRLIKTLTCSPIYETDAWGMAEETPAFLNCVVCLETSIKLDVLLDLLLEVERTLGRERADGDRGYASRTIDCDILVSSSETFSTKKLQVPHPRLASRRFVLQPLCDLDPTLHIPGEGKSVEELLKNCPLEPEVRAWDHTHT